MVSFTLCSFHSVEDFLEMPGKCCSCNGSGLCKNCSCRKRGVRCSTCAPRQHYRCLNVPLPGESTVSASQPTQTTRANDHPRTDEQTNQSEVSSSTIELPFSSSSCPPSLDLSQTTSARMPGNHIHGNGLPPRSFPVGGMYVKGIGRLTKV